MPVSSLKTKLSLVISLLMSAVLSLLALSAFWYFEREFKDAISRQQFTLVSSLADEIDGKILNVQQELVAVAGSAPPNIAANADRARDFLDAQAGMRTVFDNGIIIISPTGRLVASSPAEPLLEDRDYLFRDYVRRTIETGRPQISMPFLSTQKHRHPIIMFTAPFFGAKGKLAGVLAGAVDLMRDNFLGKLATIRIGENGYLYLYSTDRTLIVHRDRTRILRRDVPPGVNRLFDRAIEGFEGTGETVTSKGLHTVSSFKRIRSANWILAANFPQTEVYAPINKAKWYLLACLVMMPFFSILTVWWVMHHLTAPLLRFTKHVKDIAGKGDAPSPFPVTTGDEIGTLAQAFNEVLAEMEKHKSAMREQKDFSENLLLNSAVPTFVLDTRHRLIMWNRACEALTGIKATELIGTRDTWKGFYREERPVLADFVIDGISGDLREYYCSCKKSPFSPDGLLAEGWLKTASGRECYLFFDAAPIRNAEGEVMAVIETVQDFTERRRTEEELEFKNVLLSTQQETSIDGILVVDEGSNIISYNRRFIEMWDIPPELPEAATDEPVLRMVTTRVAEPESFLARVRYLYDHREEKSHEEILLMDGRVFDRYSSPMTGADGRYFGRVWYFRDISERKRMSEELLKAEKLESLGVLAGGIAHDFNNILTGILGNLSLANSRLEADHRIAGYLRDCEKAAVRAGKLTQQLMTFARGGEPVKKLIDPVSLIRETVSFVLRGSNVRGNIELEDNLWCVEADSGQLSQALHNVVLNAAQAMPDGGEVKVLARNETLGAENGHQLPAGHYLGIVIEDRGCGIPQENLARIFDPYYTTKPEGSGLGLTSFYSIVRRHGGAVEVSSTVGTGSSIIILLPALPGGQPEVEQSQTVSEPSGSGRILIMDDEDMIRDIASEILELKGYFVEGCVDGREAVERFRSARERNAPFDAVILDLTVPGGMGGMKAAAHLLEIDPDAVLIVTSGYSNDPVVANYRQYGFSGVVSKPFDAAGLAREVARLIRKKVDDG